uniref:C2H2-type domain-containing protein n=1 Tax=Lygus hesperus TaxID=30085 RepID=A0A0A9XMQ0_LYGHE
MINRRSSRYLNMAPKTGEKAVGRGRKKGTAASTPSKSDDSPSTGQKTLIDMWKKKVSDSPKGKVIPKKEKLTPKKGVEAENEEGKPYEAKCFFCPKTFKTLPGLKNHESKCKKKPKALNLETAETSKETDVTMDVLPNSVIITKDAEDPPNPESDPLAAPSEDDDDEEADEDGDDDGEERSREDLSNDGMSDEEDEEGFRKIKGDPDAEDIMEKPDENGLCLCCGEDFATAHSSGEYQCAVCQKLFQGKSSLERHIRTMHDGDNHTCPQCDAKCPDKGTLARHMYTHTGLKPYSCPVCKQEFSRKYHLVRHNMQTGCDGKAKPVFPCQVCGREFNRKDNLREHLRAHAGQTKRKKMFTCDICNEEFCGSNMLHLHRKTHLGDKQYACDFCPKKFQSSGAMKKHRRTHTGEKPYECDTCHKCFAAKETLNRHVRIHTGYKPHACNYCGKRFIQTSQLRSHLFYHTGQAGTVTLDALGGVVIGPHEPFACELCGKRFNRRARLNEHTKYTHLGAKPYECPHCSKQFIRKEDLNRHMIIHTGVKAHACPICSKSFAMKSSLKVHLLTHTKEPPRSCDECGRAFIRQDCLLRHMRNKHRDMLEEIRSEAEKKKLQQQLLQVAAEASLVDGMEDRTELDDKGLTDAVRELLTLLVDEATLRGLGWPEAGVESLLEAVIRRCGHEPAPGSTPHHDRLRHNIKLLFTVVIDDSAVKALLNNQTVDEVILHVLRLAKS